MKPETGNSAGKGDRRRPGSAAAYRANYDAIDWNRRCRVCGCTDRDCRGCIERTGQACHWVEKDLCSACAAI